MRAIVLIAFLAGVSALHKSVSSDVLRQRSLSEVTAALHEDGGADEDDETKADPTGRENDETTPEEIGAAKGAFVGFVLASAAVGAATFSVLKTRFSVTVQQESGEQSPERDSKFYNIVALAIVVLVALGMFFSVVGTVVKLNTKVAIQGPKTNVPGFEAKNVVHDRIGNPGERAFWASFAIVLQAFLGSLVCLFLRKSADVQLSVSMLTKMACRGAFAGLLATMAVEYIRLPFRNYLATEIHVPARVVVVICWVAFIALFEEVLKIGTVAFGLKRSSADQEAVSAPSIAHFIIERPREFALCGLAAGIGFACIENIPRFYEMALDQPLLDITYSFYGEAEQTDLVTEDMLRFSRVWTFIFWAMLNLQPWLTGLAAFELVKFKGPLAPMDWVSILKVVVIMHFTFDLFDRSSNGWIEGIGCSMIPYAMYKFKKSWAAAEEDGLINDRE